MVKLRDDLPRLPDGRLHVPAWIEHLRGHNAALDASSLQAACELLNVAPRRGMLLLEFGTECAELAADLRLDADSVLAALVFRGVQGRHLPLGEMEARLGSGVAHLVAELGKLADVRALELSSSPLLVSNAEDQLDNVRKMLVSLIDDVRVAILKLVERIVTLRRLRSPQAGRRSRIGRECLEVFVPLANRLGIWRLKWELEDLAFRCLNPQAYKRIAARLDGRRIERERQVGETVALLRDLLAAEGITAEVQGRAKNIYSIWVKMNAKGVDLPRVYDMRALRVLVDDVRDCYAVLGIIHTRWRHIPHEFDDYIANPKDNGYRSIHTAVVGPDGKTLEVQIRTRAMHEEAELGVCAHWAYKDGALQTRGDSFYTEKLSWLRQVLEWHEEIGGFSSLGEELRANIEQNRIFVFTPAGHVLDMSAGATPIDVAYRIHTEVGHACAGARVDGRWVPLNYPLATGQRVEIMTRTSPRPDRDWLDPELGYVKTARAKAKIKAWFKALPYEQNLLEGKQRLQREFERLAVKTDVGALASRMGYPSEQALCYAVGAMDIQVLDLVAQAGLPLPQQDQVFAAGNTELQVLDGTAGLAPACALCCRPLPGNTLMGLPTPDGAVLVHRSDCEQLVQEPLQAGVSLLELRWQSLQPEREFALLIRAQDRPGLVLAVTSAISAAGKSMTFLRAGSDPATNTATIELGLKARDMVDFARILERIRQIPGITSLQRLEPGA